MESNQIIFENFKTTLKIEKELCCIHTAIEETNAILAAEAAETPVDTSYVVDSSGVFTIASGANTTYTFTDPVSSVEFKSKDTDAESVLTIVTIPALNGGNGLITVFANDYEFLSFNNIKVVSINILNNGTTLGSYILNGTNG